MPKPSRKSGNSRAGNPHAGRLGTWLDHHGYSIVASVGRMVRKPWSTLLTVAVMALALALPLGLWLSLHNLAQLGGQLQSSREIGLFLKPEVDAAAAQRLADNLRARGDVLKVEWVGPGQALQQLQAQPDMAAAIDALGEEAARAALPSLLRITPRDDGQALARALARLPQTDQVQHDAVWRERLNAWLGFGQRVTWVLALLLGLGALLVVGNTVRLDIQSRHEEISVLQLLGASDGFVRRPFLYLGACYGLAAGGMALAILGFSGFVLHAPLMTLATRYGSTFHPHGLALLPALGVLASAGLLGWLGAGLVSGHHLRQTRPLED